MMVPGKKYTPEDFLRIAWRRKYLIVLPFVTVSVGAVLYSRSLPNIYRSETRLLILPQQVPRHFVTPTITTQIDQRLQAVSEQVRSRSRLEQLVLEYDLYPDLRQTGLMDDVIQRMNVDIQVGLERTAGKDPSSGTILKVAYESTDPAKAKAVVDRLSAMFNEANMRDREVLAQGTDQFLEAELEEARRRLEERDRAIEEYKRRHPWDQADMVENNRWALVNAQQHLQNHLNAVGSARDRLLFLEKTVADLEAMVPEVTAPPTPDAPATAAAQLEAARAQLRGLELRFTPDHPDIQRAQRVVKELEEKAAAEALTAPVSPAGAPASGERSQRLANMRHEIDKLKRTVAGADAEELRLRGIIAEMNGRIQNLPVRQREMKELTRDYELIRERYNDLMKKKETSRIAMNLEDKQIGEQIRTLEPARQPQRPIRPDRQRINLLGALIGLGLGLGLSALLEYRDTSLRTDEDVVAALALPVLALVPVMQTPKRLRGRTLRALRGTASAVLAALGSVRLWF